MDMSDKSRDPNARRPSLEMNTLTLEMLNCLILVLSKLC